jgi:predicted metalloendopeptidase
MPGRFSSPLRTAVAAGCALAALSGRAWAADERAAPVSGIDLQYIDGAVRPQDDFYTYVNGKWLAKVEIPADKPGFGSFDQLNDTLQGQLRELIEASVQDVAAPPGSEVRKIAGLYQSFVDEARLQTLGVQPLADEFAGIQSLKSRRDIAALMAHLQQLGVSVPLSPQVHLDNKDSTRYVFDLGQDGLGLPDRDYYLKDDDAKLKQMRTAYAQHVQKMLQMSGDAAAADEARDILALETRLARVQWTKVQNRDPLKVYNPVKIEQLSHLAPDFDWQRYLIAAGVDGRVGYLIISQPTYLQALDRLLVSTPLPVWKAYFRWHVLSEFARYLSRAYVDEAFAFNGTTLQGIPENRPRWKRGVALVDESIGEALGKLYVARYFPPDSKARADALVKNLLAAYHQDIDKLDWMGPATRREAQAKLAKINTKIGYPTRWRDYATLELRADDLVGNVMRANVFEYRRNVDKLGKPVDRSEWGMTPQTINAYYDPEMNEIVFPAAILQPPFFNSAADDAVNYGAIGAIIGHEISHAFDDQGSQYDGDGNLRDWWTPADHAAFAARTKALVAEYAAFEPLPGYHLNGELTLGENIADNSGLAVAYQAYRISLAAATAPLIDGLSGDQRFYMGYAQQWREKDRDNFKIEMVKVDPHSTPMFRVLGALVNQPPFYQAFDLKPGDRMYRPPSQRVIIW